MSLENGKFRYIKADLRIKISAYNDSKCHVDCIYLDDFNEQCMVFGIVKINNIGEPHRHKRCIKSE